MKRKYLYYAFAGLCTLLLILFLVFVIFLNSERGQTKAEKLTLKLPDKELISDHVISHYYLNKKLYSIKIKKINITHKKMGFVKIGFLRIAQIDDLEIDIFEDNLRYMNKHMSENNEDNIKIVLDTYGDGTICIQSG